MIFALFRGGLGGFFVTASSPLFGVSFFANSQFPQPPCEGGLGPRSQKTYTCSLKKKEKKVEGSKDGGRVVVLLTDDENVLCFHSSSFLGVKDSFKLFLLLGDLSPEVGIGCSTRCCMKRRRQSEVKKQSKPDSRADPSSSSAARSSSLPLLGRGLDHR